MRKLLLALFTLVILVAGYHLGSMGALAMADGAHFHASMDPDCPMGYVCPMRAGSIDFTAAQPIVRIWTVVASVASGFLCVAWAGIQTGYTPPFSIAYNSGPPVLRSTVKRE